MNSRFNNMVSNKYLSLKFGLLILIASAVGSDLRRILPSNLKIREGEDLQLRLTSVLDETVSCYVKTPSLTSYNLKSEELDSEGEISYWTESGECGVVKKNVSAQDAGRWRLTAKNSTHTLVDSTFIEILDKVEVPEKSFSIESGIPYTLSLDEQSKYCRIREPHTDETLLVSGECKVELDRPTSAVQGNWIATAGVIGQLQEVSVNAELNVFRGRLATGFKRNEDTNTINAYCNLMDSDKGFEFCRFSKPDSARTGFQLSEGLRSGRYGYYGSGLENGECGITIETPNEEDYGQWLCSVGIKDEEPLGSYVWINSSVQQVAAITAKVLPTNLITTVLNGVLQLKCETNVAIGYCWLRGPNGEVFTPKRISNEFGSGVCDLEIPNAESKHEGQWTCHMGPESSGFEVRSILNVRISETHLAAKNQRIAIKNGETLTLECRTVPKQIAIDYCRFSMPDGRGIRIGDEIEETSPLMLDGVRYWFSGSSLKLGGCGLKVDKVSSKHFGNWTCAAQLELSDSDAEVFDTIIVEQGELESSSTSTATQDNSTAGATTGIISGVLIMVGILAAGSMYVVKRIRARGFRDNISEVDTISVGGSSTSSNSTNSGISLQEFTNDGERR